MDDALKTAVAAGFVTFNYPAGSQLYEKGAMCEETHILLSGESATTDLSESAVLPRTSVLTRDRRR